MSFGGGNHKSQEEINAEMANNQAMANAQMAQANASLEAAKVMAAGQTEAAKAQAQATIEAAKAGADASIKASQNAALGGVLGAALGAHTTSEVIKQWLPSEVGAETIRSWKLAEMWNTTRTMREQGYQDVAIQYQLSGKKGETLFSDAQWNAMQMVKLTKQDMLTNARIFGVQTPSNPGGIPISQQDWLKLNSVKDPQELLKVDPQVAAQREQAFQQWEQQMRASGNGLLVDIYKNPQLGGSSILTMKGKDPILDPALAPLIGQITGGDKGAGSAGTNWTQAIDALTKGEQNPMTAQVQALMQKGVVDKYGMINSGELMKYIPPDLQKAPEFNMYKQLSEDEIVRLTSQYDQLANMTVDPKYIREQNVGFGVTRRIKLNPDGTIAATALEGYMTDAMGNPVWVSMNGNQLSEFYERKKMVGPMFPGDSVLAPVTMEEKSGSFEPGFWGQNMLAQPAGKTSVNTSSAAQAGQGVQSYPAPAGDSEETPNSTSGLASALKQGSTPSGYTGAPLAAGE